MAYVMCRDEEEMVTAVLEWKPPYNNLAWINKNSWPKNKRQTW